MKKMKKVTLILFLVIGIILISCGNVNAHSVELDPNSLISLPTMIINGKGNITIKSSETGYSLYYQAVEISNTDFEQIEQIVTNGKKEINSINEEMDALDVECDNLEKIYDDAYNAYKEAIDNGVTGTELETLKTAYETAKTNYQNKINEYNAKVEEHNNKVNELDSKLAELTPTYVEGNWTKTEDGSFSIDVSTFTDERYYAVWVKLVSSDGSVSYDVQRYGATGTKTEETNVDETGTEGGTETESVGTTPDASTEKSAESNVKDTTVANGKLPQTGGTITMVAVIASLILISVVLYKSYNKYKDIK